MRLALCLDCMVSSFFPANKCSRNVSKLMNLQLSQEPSFFDFGGSKFSEKLKRRTVNTHLGGHMGPPVVSEKFFYS